MSEKKTKTAFFEEVRKLKENIIEIFSSIQGEGKYVGCRQVFVRFEGCNLKCSYCDTHNEVNTHPQCQVELEPGSGKFAYYNNPLSADEVADIIKQVMGGVPHHSVSFTGGEPLLHVDFIKELSDKIHLPIFLETNGTLARQLQEIIDITQYISMDIKLPSVLQRDCWKEHRAFLEVAKQRDTYVKVVVAAETDREEFLQAVRLVADIAPETLLIIQPVTPYGGCHTPAPGKIMELQGLALEHLRNVRVIPQTHRMINLL